MTLMSDVLDLFVLDSGVGDHAIAVARSGADLAITRLPFGQQLQKLTDFRNVIEGAVRGTGDAPTTGKLRDFGEDLFNFTFRDAIAELYSQLPKDDVRLHIVCDRAEIENLPWEYLQEPRKKRGPQRGRSIVRVVPTIGQARPKPRPLASKVRVLFVSAAPTDQGDVAWEEVHAAVERAFNANLPDDVTMTLVDGADPKALRQAILREKFDIFHFSGHGRVKDGKGQLILVDRKSRKSQYVDAEQLSAILSGRGLRLVVLSACLTATGDFQDDFSVIAAALVRSGIPAVVANQMPISNKTISPFVGQMYGTLMTTGDIDLAMTEGRIALYTDLAKDASSGLEWGIPTLYRHHDAAQIYKRRP
jgi:hypothetical protein